MSNIEYSVCAVVFGADESILNIKLNDDFSFVKRSLCNDHIEMTKTFKTDLGGLRINFENAIIDRETLDLICVEKKICKEIESSEVKKYFIKQSDLDLQSLDNQIRLIRLLGEGPLRCKEIAFNLNSDEFSIECLLPVGESHNTDEISKFCCGDVTEKINSFLEKKAFPFEDEILSCAHRFYDLSYHTELFVSLTLLTIALEVLFLEHDECSKKIKLSKRCSTYLNTDAIKIKDMFDKLKLIYEKRSGVVHEGKVMEIDPSDIIFLRDCVRKSILKVLDNDINKNERIEILKDFIKTNKIIFGD